VQSPEGACEDGPGLAAVELVLLLLLLLMKKKKMMMMRLRLMMMMLRLRMRLMMKKLRRSWHDQSLVVTSRQRRLGCCDPI